MNGLAVNALERDPRGRGVFLTLLLFGTFGLVVWTIYLGWVLPRTYVAGNWRLAWVGLDSAQVVVLLFTTWAAYRRRVIIIFFATASASMFLIDAWFDITTARTGELQNSLLAALVVEIPAAMVLLIVSSVVVRRVLRAWQASTNDAGAPSAWRVQIPRH